MTFTMTLEPEKVLEFLKKISTQIRISEEPVGETACMNQYQDRLKIDQKMII